jgi:MFS family permease
VSFKSISAGELFDLIMPVASVISALLSTWVLASARRRFRFYYAIALAIGTLFLPLIVFPIYLVLMLWHKRSDPPPRWRYALPLLYLLVVLSVLAADYFYR